MTHASVLFAGVAIVVLLVIIKAMRSPMDWKNWVIVACGCVSIVVVLMIWPLR